ncbi:RUN and FYVE domain-containing protein 2 isoform X2 [Hermetia illucens]|uniref:RUN and FYVE domain-containing protein 2 isoform X2 n=1 Tax=Hermetia illucens TaxID=343691 RepID=UPI0018CC1AA4|nr:RUN and FYVE domain-containing protein 2 isoform X2 [Hermetia illucens]
MRGLSGSPKKSNTSSTGAIMQTNNSSNTIALPKPQHANNPEDIVGGVQDTIYLCNFRVSVDGEWLCLKELQDLEIQDGNGGGGNAGGVGGKRTSLEESRDPAAIERSNLVNICKLVVKELLEQSLRFGRMLDSDHLPLQHFFIVLEHVLRHGLKPKKGLLGPKKELWDILQSVEKYCIEAQDITTSVRDLPTVRTHMGRARAWLRIALMQKKLADYLQALIEHREEALAEYYEPHALMMSDEVVVIMGILVGLNVIDCNLCVKEEDLDSQQGVIDFSLYLRSSSRTSPEDEGAIIEGPGGNMNAVLDQKNYIEELNRHLNATVANLQAKVESLTTTNALMKEDLAIARNSLLALQAENQALRQSINRNSQSNISQTGNGDNHSQSGSDRVSTAEMELSESLADERKKTQELEKELKIQISLKAETDMAMKLLEKDIHEKQDTIVSLRRQLEDIKQINLEMYKKLQECEASLKHKTELLGKLESQKEDMATALSQLEKKYSLEKSNLSALQESTKSLSSQVTMSDERAARAEADVRLEREWRINLQEKEVKLKEQINNLQMYVRQLGDESKKSEHLKIELEKVRNQWSEAQKTLEELGIQLSVSKLQVSELQEKVQTAEKVNNQNEPANVWIPDKDATHCKGCSREFSMTRRKHHCRNCGEVFCHNCSEQAASLPNERGQMGKPVRVCDTCWKNITKT